MTRAEYVLCGKSPYTGRSGSFGPNEEEYPENSKLYLT
jgi:hypothetical protein